MAISNFLRSMAASTPYDSLFAYSFGHLICSSLLLAIMRGILKDRFHLPYYAKTNKAKDSSPNEGEALEEFSAAANQ